MDFEQWVAQCSAGVMHKLIFILPFFRKEELKQGQDLLTLMASTLTAVNIPSNFGGDVG